VSYIGEILLLIHAASMYWLASYNWIPCTLKSFFYVFGLSVILYILSVLTDPEEMRQAQEQMRQQGIPSLSNLVAGRS
jgi:hypothetical protein